MRNETEELTGSPYNPLFFQQRDTLSEKVSLLPLAGVHKRREVSETICHKMQAALQHVYLLNLPGSTLEEKVAKHGCPYRPDLTVDQSRPLCQ